MTNVPPTYLAELNPHERDSHITFDEGPHIYTIHGDSNYTSVTTWNHYHFEQFDADRIIKSMMNGKNWNPINIAIVDSGADLVLFRRQDGAFLGSIDIAIRKATSSAMIPRSTRKVGELAYGENGELGPRPGVATVDFLVPFAGGLPIRTDAGHLIGAIGISGASSDQDEECAQVAIDSVKDLLK